MAKVLLRLISSDKPMFRKFSAKLRKKFQFCATNKTSPSSYNLQLVFKYGQTANHSIFLIRGGLNKWLKTLKQSICIVKTKRVGKSRFFLPFEIVGYVVFLVCDKLTDETLSVCLIGFTHVLLFLADSDNKY
jgi:hypothetical protein